MPSLDYGCELLGDVAAYALQVVTPAESLRVEWHLTGCQVCAQALEWMVPVAMLLDPGMEQQRAA